MYGYKAELVTTGINNGFRYNEIGENTVTTVKESDAYSVLPKL
jgi:hypothetical protein